MKTLIECQELQHLANIYAEAALDLSVDMYHDQMAGCEPLDATEIRVERFQALSEALEALVTRELAGRHWCRMCNEVEIPAWSDICNVCEAWGFDYQAELDRELDRLDDLRQEARQAWLSSVLGPGDE